MSLPAASLAIVYFRSPADLRDWFEQHHQTAQEQWVGYHKKNSGVSSITWPESVDEALCFGWIDGFEKGMDTERYAIRFSPRQPNSNWTNTNKDRARRMIAEGRMTPAGRAKLPADVK